MIACAQCGAAMPTPTGRASRKRFCSVDCRKAAWRERHRHNAVPAVPAVPTA
jgi:predicted nucleic acid-binding Zn ribbon protein